METREILVANTKTQKRSKITTDASTLGELKAALSAAGVDYEGMDFTEGISKTHLLEDGTQLPQNVMYKGRLTNNLVILLTNIKKNIESGIHAADRQAAYSIIKEHNLQEDVKETFGRNFTQVPTADLQKFIAERTSGSDYDEDIEEVDIEPTEEDFDDPADYAIQNVVDAVSNLYNKGILDIIDMLALIGRLTDIITKAYGDEDADTEVSSEPVSTSDGSITDEDIDRMISEMK